MGAFLCALADIGGSNIGNDVCLLGRGQSFDVVIPVDRKLSFQQHLPKFSVYRNLAVTALLVTYLGLRSIICSLSTAIEFYFRFPTRKLDRSRWTARIELPDMNDSPLNRIGLPYRYGD